MWLIKQNKTRPLRLVDDFFSQLIDETESFGNSFSRLAPVEVNEQDNSTHISIELPGFDKKEIQIEYKNGYLLIEATKMNQENEVNNDQTYSEFAKGTVKRSIYVGDINFEKTKAELGNGILSITLPKKEIKKLTLPIQ